MKTKITPGPWECEIIDDEDGKFIYISPIDWMKNGDSFLILHPLDYESASVINEADAKLISQAPAMLDLLKEIAADGEKKISNSLMSDICDMIERIEGEE